MRVLALAALCLACACAPAPRPASHFQMHLYYLVLLKRGPAWSAGETAESRRLFEGHMANIRALARTGKLVLAGPFESAPEKKDALAGLFLFDVPTVEEVRTLVASDPAVAAGRLVPEILQWYGPAGLTYDGRAEALAAH